ncbi:MAG: hypothetical protein A2W93_02825 [Bacteroidetes bacterium GWF2_43_63]|nr:MAG: hypothetical protein A2W93_02825 [Bacteroidetes bacterium GWF2_43_63]
MNREYTVGVSFDISYKGLSFTENSQPDSTIYAEVSGRGFSLIRFYFEQPFEISLSPADFKSVKRGDSIYLSVLPDNLRESAIEVLPAGISMTNIPDETLSFTLISYPSKDVAVKVNLKHDANQNCIVNGPVKIIPRVVRITGPAELIAGIDSVNTLPVDLSGLCDTVRTTVKIAPLSNNKVRCNVSEIHILVPISSVVQIETKLHYNITILGHIYNGEVTTVFQAPANTVEPELNLTLETDIVESNLVFSVNCPQGYKILSISPESIPLEK